MREKDDHDGKPLAALKPYEIVLGFDFSPLAERAFSRALDALQHSAPAELHVVSVAMADGFLVHLPGEAPPMTEAAATEMLRLRVSRMLDDYQLQKGPVALERVAVYVLTGVSIEEPGQLITDLATSVDANLIVVGTHGKRGIERMLLGSVAQDVVRRASCDVLVVRPPDMIHGEAVPVIEPPLVPGQPHLRQFEHRRTYHYVDKVSNWTSRTMPVS